MRLKTSEAQRKAIKKHNDKFDSIMVRCEAGTKEKIQKYTGLSANAYIKNLIDADLKKYEN